MEEKITKGDVIQAMRDKGWDSEWEGDWEDDWELSEGEAVDLLNHFDVDHATERCYMLNVTSFDVDDVVNLANVQFYVTECDMCGEDVYEVQPDNWDDFQMIRTKGEIMPISIDGKEKYICDECYGNPIFH